MIKAAYDYLQMEVRRRNDGRENIGDAVKEVPSSERDIYFDGDLFAASFSRTLPYW